ncbi:flagellar hook assembly protein FlgD [Chitinimonas lacunae]|uniref:Basal-body rod modification protein FlgD n=1 Tax=Chitinimonas lacunae TaxID=1963018 RepID=A0ABV8ML30_9NEIS
MLAVNSSTNAPNPYASLNGKTTDKTEMEQTQDRFLKLLVKQLQSQDPMNPMDSAQSTAQMAQINTVTGIEKLNQTMTTMMSTFQAGLSVQAASMAAGLVGREVIAPGDKTTVKDGTTLAEVGVKDGVSNVEVTVYSESGTKVGVVKLGNVKPGRQAIDLNGIAGEGQKLPDGNYRLVAAGVDKDGKQVQLDTFTKTKVVSVGVSGTGINLNLPGNRSVSLGDVTQIM